MIGHRRCHWCREIGHKGDMVRESTLSCFADKGWFHRECYKGYLDRWGMEECSCGKSIIYKPEQAKKTKSKKK